MPNRDDRSWLDALSDTPLNLGNYPGYAVGATKFAGNALSNIARSMSPVRFEDADGPTGQAGFHTQVPPMISETAGAWDRLFGEQNNWHDGPGEVYPGDMNADAATAALAFYGGNALNTLRAGGKPRLPMDAASRMVRARELGFDVDNPVYHGSRNNPKPFNEFDLSKSGKGTDYGWFGEGVYTTPNEFRGANYAGENGHVRELYGRMEAPFEWRAGEPAAANALREMGLDLRNVPQADKGRLITEALRNNGYDGVNVTYPGSSGIDERVFFQPNQLRDINAAFDPARAGENGLLLSDNKPSILGSAVAGAGDNGPRGRYYDLFPDDADVTLESLAPFASKEGTTRHAYDIASRNGDEAGRVELALNAALGEGYIDNITLLGNERGAAGMRDVIRSIKAAHPEIKKLYGERTSGAKAGTENTTQSINLLSDNKPSLLGSAVATADQPQGITAYHGSPHDFDKFSLDKIGTGEGAQAYGRGLYFAENEGVARSYRDAHKPSAPFANDPSFLKWMEENGKSPEGRMYQVRINADPNDFLDWDLPLSQQSEKVRNALSSVAQSKAEALAASDRLQASKAEAMGMKWNMRAVDPLSLTGSQIANHTGIREAGIPGIRYKDALSRGTDGGSSNYVVFDDATIEILKKYGLTGAVLGAGALGLTGTEASAEPAPQYDPELEEIIKRYQY